MRQRMWRGCSIAAMATHWAAQLGSPQPQSQSPSLSLSSIVTVTVNWINWNECDGKADTENENEAEADAEAFLCPAKLSSSFASPAVFSLPRGPLSLEFISTGHEACSVLLCTCYSLDRNQRALSHSLSIQIASATSITPTHTNLSVCVCVYLCFSFLDLSLAPLANLSSESQRIPVGWRYLFDGQLMSIACSSAARMQARALVWVCVCAVSAWERRREQLITQHEDQLALRYSLKERHVDVGKSFNGLKIKLIIKYYYIFLNCQDFNIK